MTPTLSALFRPSARVAALLAVAVAGLASPALAQVDNLITVVNSGTAVGGLAVTQNIATYGYDPLHNKMYIAGDFGAGQVIRVVNNVDGVQAYQDLVTNTPWIKFSRDGDTTRGGGAQIPGSMLLNPVAIDAIPAYGLAVITDRPGTVSTGGVSNPELTQYVYRYNLQLDTNADARDEFTSLVTLKQYRDTPGITTTTGTATTNRQVTYSSDARTVYFVESASAFKGLWSVPTLGGAAPTRLVNDTLQTEPTLLNRGGVDYVLIEGTAATNNLGGIDAYNTVTGERTSEVSGIALADFMQTTTADIDIRSLARDADGNIYFTNADSGPDRRGLYKVTPDGRYIKVVTFAERKAFFGSTANPETANLQPRTATFSGPNGSFSTTQILYRERQPLNSVSGAFVFKPGDFDRDNDVDAGDLGLFGASLTPRNVVAPVASGRYDLNGNGVIDWKDVKVLQTFLGFRDGDANFDRTVSFDDLLTLAQNYGKTSGMTWITGDFSGDDAVNFDDLLTLAQNYGQSGLGEADVAGLGATFAADWALAQSLVPEPALLTAAAAMGALIGRRRRI